MSKLEKTIKTEKKEVVCTITKKSEVYNLELTEDELKVLYVILCKIGGSPTYSFRKMISNITAPMIREFNCNTDDWYVQTEKEWYKKISDNIVFHTNHIMFNPSDLDLSEE